jgi:hypothetical protein
VLAFFLISTSRSFSQITITSGDLSGMAGSRQVVREDGRASIPVNVGSAGANQIWDFRTMTIANPVLAVSQFLSPQGLPGSNRFPGATLVQKITSSAAAGAEIYNFYRIISSSFTTLGDSSKITSPIDTTFVRLRNDIVTPLPVAFNNTWRQTKRDTTGFFPLAANISIDTTNNTIDAWGTVRLPLGDFQCLRIRQNVKIINQAILNGTVSSTSTRTYIQYNWVAKNAFQVARAQSQDNDTNLNFTNARGFGLLDSLRSGPTTDVDDTAALPLSFELLQNYPNPFNPETVIEYQTKLDGPVELAVYNLSGEKVRVLVNEIHPAGNYKTRWNGTDDSGNRVSSGMYFYRLKSGNFVLSKKMVLLQ